MEYKLNCEDFEKYKDLLLNVVLSIIKEREGMGKYYVVFIFF